MFLQRGASEHGWLAGSDSGFHGGANGRKAELLIRDDKLNPAEAATRTIELSERWQLNAGVRVERYETDFLSVAVPGSGVATIQLDTSDTLTSWNTGVVFKPLESGSIYLSAATTSTPPGMCRRLPAAIAVAPVVVIGHRRNRKRRRHSQSRCQHSKPFHFVSPPAYLDARDLPGFPHGTLKLVQTFFQYPDINSVAQEG